jgi:hypothetical protein
VAEWWRSRSTLSSSARCDPFPTAPHQWADWKSALRLFVIAGRVIFETTLPAAWTLVVTSMLAACVAALFLGIATNSFIPLIIPFIAAAAMTWFVARLVLTSRVAKRVLIAFPWLIAAALTGVFAFLAFLVGSIRC